MRDEVTVVFIPSGLRGRFPAGTSVLQAARTLGVDLESVCGGQGQCGRCQVKHSIGAFPKFQINSRIQDLSPPTELEKAQRSDLLKRGRRLGCASRLLGDAVIDVPPDSQVHQQHIAKEVTHCGIDLDPAVTLYQIRMPPPDVHDQTSDLSRLLQVLEVEFKRCDLSCELSVLQQLKRSKEAGDWKISVAVHRSPGGDSVIIAVWPGWRDRLFGLAVDLGSTTIAVHLCDLSNGDVIVTKTRMNPQIRFGEDLMSRVSYVMLNEGGDKEMTRVVREALSELAHEAAASAGITPEEIVDMTVVCNPVMHHLLMGLDPTPLGSAPFTLVFDQAVLLKACELGFMLHPQARVYVLPCLAGHIGADTAGMILAERPDLADEITLLVDVGTNAEIVLGNRRRLLAASSPTGPAFEGAQISCGQRAAPGAVERVRIDHETLEPSYKVIGCDLWSDEAGFSRKIGKSGITGICGSGIIELIGELFLAGVIDLQGLIDPTMANRSRRIVAEGRTFSYLLHQGNRTLSITQNDVRAVQLAKAALYAGVRLLMDHLGVDRVERIGLAGAFGSHIDVKYAMVLGLIPDCDLSAVSSLGNAAGTGARIALLNQGKRAEIETLLGQVEKVETAMEPRFQEHFVNALALPHRLDSFEQLGRVVRLPEKGRGVVSMGRGTNRGRRRKPGVRKSVPAK
ncbi:MAG: DUF4445 domain-containing protein [Gammaproteobacteria bacterium]|nr:DUF4445 domain-containing protein [Gammaproteobacteria bacterium]